MEHDQDTSPYPKLVTTKTAAAMLGISVTALNKQAQRGTAHYILIDHVRFWKMTEIERLIAQRTTRTQADTGEAAA